MRKTILSITYILLLSLVLTGCAGSPLESSTPTAEATLPIDTPVPSPVETPEPPTPSPTPIFELDNPDPYAIKYAEIIEFYWGMLHLEDGGEAFVRLDEVFHGTFSKDNDEFNDEEREAWRLWFTCAEIKPFGDNIGYAIYDVNGDGIPELFIVYSGYDENGDSYVAGVCAVYTLCDDVPALVDAYSARYRGAIDATGTFYIWSHSGASVYSIASYYLVPGSAELRMIEFIGKTFYDEETGKTFGRPQYYWIKDGEKIFLDEDEFEAIGEAMPDPFDDQITRYAGLVVIPLI